VAYLDHAASAPLRPEVAEAMAPYGNGRFGNPSGSHQVARAARRALDEARQQVADFLGTEPGEVVFTSGGTEADNLAVLGPLAAQARLGRPAAAVVCSAVEHPAVLEAARWAARPLPGASAPELCLLPVDAGGVVLLEALDDLLGPGVGVVSVMLANNEVGSIQPLAMVADAVRRRAPGAVLHTDAVQAAPFVDLSVAAAPADLISISAHKLGGPTGVGALGVRHGTALAPLLHGGGQERELRSGTQDVAGIVGLAAACSAVAAGREAEGVRVAGLRDRLAAGLASLPGVRRTAAGAAVLPGHCHVLVAGVDREELVLLLDGAGVCASAGSACASGALEASHVLAAMGVTADEARGALRFSVGWTSTDADVDQALSATAAAVGRLRG